MTTTWVLVILMTYHSVVIEFPTGETACLEALKETRNHTSGFVTSFCLRRT